MIVGLGNPGKQYERTRHNMGFCAMDILAGKLAVRVNKSRFQALTATATYRGQKLLLLQPQTFMNASGLAVSQAASYYKIPAERIIVMFDDISLPVGKLRVRPSGSAGGHNGLKSIASSLGTQEYPRVKIGVGAKPSPEYDLAQWVLAAVPKADQPAIQESLEKAAEAALCIVEHGVEQAQARFN